MLRLLFNRSPASGGLHDLYGKANQHLDGGFAFSTALIAVIKPVPKTYVSSR
jgi:hypothetical protein